MEQHKHILNEQDDHLNEIADIANRLHNAAVNINVEIDHQGKQITQLDVEMDKTQKKMNFVQKKLGDLLKTNDQSQICTILILFGTLCALIFLLIYT
ncbi:unnamed protein product (macronuclear) [Paramecium tetraurelia]|uniref:t-SNARE coiled-coil homology domain-containing protein n=1 Tax=Paramecium tetraurelia TaxID=5888 RepID=A0BY35_PARTE|nr:uncharacterized protein GSPATT00033305001 [Paramecium tetraurelia]CAK63452.1 unnamed protein product [Paramecium tetraurelia]|eukprot:XP_001430850.1 hypothetical protein (macronuclear) [Paramecium tetraurelia strain d4-2]